MGAEGLVHLAKLARSSASSGQALKGLLFHGHPYFLGVSWTFGTSAGQPRRRPLCGPGGEQVGRVHFF